MTASESTAVWSLRFTKSIKGVCVRNSRCAQVLYIQSQT